MLQYERVTRRLQILIDEERYARLEREARRSHRSVAAAIREAIDRTYPPDLEAKERHWIDYLSAAPMEVPETVEKLKRQIEEATAAGCDRR